MLNVVERLPPLPRATLRRQPMHQRAHSALGGSNFVLQGKMGTVTNAQDLSEKLEVLFPRLLQEESVAAGLYCSQQPQTADLHLSVRAPWPHCAHSTFLICAMFVGVSKRRLQDARPHQAQFKHDSHAGQEGGFPPVHV